MDLGWYAFVVVAIQVYQSVKTYRTLYKASPFCYMLVQKIKQGHLIACMEPSFCSVSFPTRTSVGRQPGSQLSPWSFPYRPVSLSPLEWPPLHLPLPPDPGSTFQLQSIAMLGNPSWFSAPHAFIQVLLFHQKKTDLCGPQGAVGLSWWHSAARERKECRSKILLLPQCAERASHRNYQSHPPGLDVRTLETLGRCWVDQALASPCAAWS